MKRALALLFVTVALATAFTATASAATIPNTRYDWWITRNGRHVTPWAPSDARAMLAKWKGVYAYGMTPKVIYLTMDEGYENGYTASILDVLKRNNVKVTFFCTGSYIRSRPALVRRMINEGHLVGNHTNTHPNMVAKAPNYPAYKAELDLTAAAYWQASRRVMPKIVRMPSGIYSPRCLAINAFLGYKTYFWSFAYADWDPARQPSLSHARSMMLDNAHPGEVMLIHAVSRSNYLVLDGVLKTLKAQGYTFKLLPQ
jgi:peptidoglycan-N-acetylmuramic acid deacetylase